jgi:hypothetical protein
MVPPPKALALSSVPHLIEIEKLLLGTSKNTVHGSTGSPRTALFFNFTGLPFVLSLSKDE